MIPIALLEEFISYNFITSIEISHFTRNLSKPNNLRNVNPARNGRRNVTIQTKLYWQNSSHPVNHKLYKSIRNMTSWLLRFTALWYCLRLGLSWFNWWVSFAPEFLCCYFCESSCLFYLSFNFDFYVSKIMHLWVRNLPRKPNNYVSEEPRQN